MRIVRYVGLIRYTRINTNLKEGAFMERFILRPWRAADAAAVAQAANDPTIAANMRNAFPFPYTQTDAERFLAGCIANEG